MPLELITPRLRLRSFVADDASLLHELDSDPEVLRYVGQRQPGAPEDYRTRIETTYRDYDTRLTGLGFWAVIESQTQEFLGWVCLRPATDYRFFSEAQLRDDDMELGYRFRRTAWGRGIATEAARAVVDCGFRQAAPPRIVASALVPNRGSTRVMEKCGLQRLYEFTLDGFDSPGVVYALTREAWETA